MDKAQAIIFYITVFTALAGAIGVIFSKKIINSIFYAFLSFLSIGLLFLALEMQYLAVVQIFLCAVAIPVVFVFASILTNRGKEIEISISISPRTFFSALELIGVVLLITAFLKYNSLNELLGEEASVIVPSVKEFSIEMFTNYAAPFIFSSILFLTVILGLGVIFSTHRGGKKHEHSN
ncbi:MAG: NADH-quinone oxidoreductase subunit J [Candidatus Gastranaerophilaceae bacterium]